jgi:ubiquinone/menaquinone biosynthesis C-methylase UbiE
MGFSNSYQDRKRAKAYSKLEFPGTYYLAYRDLPAIISKYVRGTKALDFGCGTGRSTRFLQRMGFKVIGVDISREMLKKAMEIAPQGDYRLISECDLTQLEDSTFDLILSAFTFDNIPTMEKKVNNFREITRTLSSEGVIINLVSSPDIYRNEWASFSTKDFPENKQAKVGDRVRIIQLDTEDKRPVEDIMWADEDYRRVYAKANLRLIETYRPLAKLYEPYDWVNETKIAPWVIYVLR